MARRRSASSPPRAASITDQRVSGKRSPPCMDLCSLIFCCRHLPVPGDVAACCCSLCRKEQADKAPLRLNEDGLAGTSREGRCRPPTRYVHRSVKQVYEP